MHHADPKTWKDYAEQVKTAKASQDRWSKTAKDQMVKSHLVGADGMPNPAGFRKLGQQFVGPILVRLKYEGVTRDLLTERPLAQGALPIFSAWDHIGMAYVLNDYSGEVQVTRMEAKRFMAPLMRIAARVIIPKGEVYAMDFDLVERAKQQMLENIMRREDKRYYATLDSSIDDYIASTLPPEYEDAFYPDSTTANYDIAVAGGKYTHLAYVDAFGTIAQAQLMPSKILINVGDYMDVFQWSLNDIGYAAVERLTETGVLPHYGLADFKPSVTVAPGKSYVQPDPEYVGYFPVRYSVQVQEHHDPSKFEYGWVMDEEVGFVILNARGLIRLRKV
jgi:hypothetical protein